MARILILILALNAFISPVSAENVFSIPMGSGKMSMMQNMSSHCAEMNDGAEMSCCSLECVSECASHFSPFTTPKDSLELAIVVVNNNPQTALSYFYKIVLPILTPPPLV